MFAELKKKGVYFTNEEKTKGYVKTNVPIVINHNLRGYSKIKVKSHFHVGGVQQHRTLKYDFKWFRLNGNGKLKRKLSKQYGIKMSSITVEYSYRYFKSLNAEMEFVTIIHFKGEGILQKIRKHKIKKLLLEWEN